MNILNVKIMTHYHARERSFLPRIKHKTLESAHTFHSCSL